MKKLTFLRRVKSRILAFIFCDLAFIFLILILAGSLLKYTLAFIILFTLLCLSISSYREYTRQEREKKLISKFIFETNFQNKNFLIDELGDGREDLINQIFSYLQDKDLSLDKKDQALNSYREFVEKRTHEIKTPLAISNLLLENHSDEISPYVKERLSYIQNSTENDVDKILYYARSNLDHMDYKLKKLQISEILGPVLEKYYPIIAERGIIVKENYKDFSLMSDTNVLSFIISQIMSNSAKYTLDKIEIESLERQKDNLLIIRNNGGKVAEEDAPFIFEKGFTGERNNSQKATGMGLYLAKKYCDDLGLKIGIYENVSDTFSIFLSFPKIPFTQTI